MSRDPLSFLGQSMTSLCGKVLAHAEPVMMVDLSQRPMPDFSQDEEASSLRDCRECLKRAERHPDLLDDFGAPGMAGRKVYLYEIVDGESARQFRGDCIQSLLELAEKAGK
jgi:hypothetical protein